ncbi:pyridoxal phosphate-dependent aminotransferase [Rhodocaloribacter sp.]
MTRHMNRREWLTRSGMLAATSFVFGPGALAARGRAPARSARAARAEMIRLHSNENPFGPSPRAREAMTAAFDLGNRYPAEHYRELTTLIAEAEGLTPDHVFLGAGSHEVLRVAGVAYGLEGGEVVTPYPTYERMGVYAEAVGARVHRVPLTPGFDTDLDAMDRRTTNGVKMVFVCNPNNPTGMVIPADRLRAFCEDVSRRAVVFVDEAYHEYVDDPAYASMTDLVKAGENVIVSRTFSKIYGLAGLRVGYGLARPDIVARLKALTTAHSVNILGLSAAKAAFADEPFRTMSRRENAGARAFLSGVLDELGYRYLPSQSNFVFFHVGEDVRAFGEKMRGRGIRVGRPFPPYLDWCRVSIGTRPEMEAFVTALRSVSAP